MVTKARDLRTGRPVWAGRRAVRVPHRRLARDIETEVLVIGAGITGAMVADALTQAGHEVAVVDKRGLAKGSTAASSALVLYEIDTPMIRLARKIGKKDAARAWQRSRLAVDALAARLRELPGAGVMRRDALYLAGDALDKDELAREHDARCAAGLMSELFDRKALRRRFGIARQAALLAPDNLAIDPRHTTLALLRATAQRKAQIFAPVEIVDLDARKSGVTAVAADRRRIRCQHLVFASGYELPDHVPRRGHQVVSTWVIATVAQPRRLWPERCMIWEASDPYLYVRTTPEGRVICGGEDEDFSDADKRDALLGRKTQTLRRKLARLFPRLDTTVEFAWTGTFGQSSTGLPKIGPVPGLPNCWAALGYGGNGITYARIAADIIGGAVSGHADVDADLYDF